MKNQKLNNKLQVTVAFVLFSVLSLFLSVMVSTVFVGKQTSDTLRNYQHERAQTEAQLIAHYIEQFLETRIQLLTDISQQPVLINGVMGSDMTYASMSDFLDDYKIVGKNQPIWLFNVLSEHVYSNSNDSKEITDFAWTKPLLDDDIEHAISLVQVDEGYYFSVAIPVKYNGLTEGILIVQFTKSLNELLADVINSDTSGVTLTGPWLGFSTLQKDITYQPIAELKLGRSGLVLNYQLNLNIVERKISTVIVSIVLSIITSLLIAWLILYLGGQKLLLDPYKK